MLNPSALIIILDGLGDAPCPVLGEQTPLQFAPTPTLDRLAARSQTGLMDPLAPGLPVDTHTGVAMLFGVPPRQAVHIARGPIEAAGIDLDTRPGDLLLRCNFAHVEPTAAGLTIIDRRAGRVSDEVADLCHALATMQLDDGITASLHPSTQHRCVLRLRGAASSSDVSSNLSAAISDTDPGDNPSTPIKMARPLVEEDAAAHRTAHALNQFTAAAHKILHPHPLNQARLAKNLPPANAVITRAAGVVQPLHSIIPRLGLSAAVVAGERTILGLGKLLGFHTLTDPAFTSLPDTDVVRKLHCARAALAEHALVFLHIKATDTTAHDRAPHAKAAFLARFDTAMATVMDAAPTDDPLAHCVIAITADHSTDSVRGIHTGEPVPILIHNPHGRRDRVSEFNEIACAEGSLHRLTAHAFIHSVLDSVGALPNYRPHDHDLYALAP